MWLKLIFLLLYVIVMFLLARFLEIAAWYEAGFLASRLINPVSLSVQKLKSLLDQRGTSYATVLEKRELTSLVQQSGEVSEGELEEAGEDETEPTLTRFNGGMHFYEEVEDTKDSVWLVEVLQDRTSPLLPSDQWKKLAVKVAKFGVRTGVFDCSLDRGFCNKKNWRDPRLILSLPRGMSRAKDNVVLHGYAWPAKLDHITDWISRRLNSRIINITSVREFKSQWLRYDNNTKTQVQVVLFSKLHQAPMFLSTLAVKFTGRVKIGYVSMETSHGRHLHAMLNLTKPPTYWIHTREHNYTYGERTGEYYNYRSMEVFLKSLYPEVNDLFLGSIILMNALCCMEFFLVNNTLVKRLRRFILALFKYNMCVILLWLPFLALFQMHSMSRVCDFALTVLRHIGGTNIVCSVRNQWSYFRCQPWVILLTFIAFGAAVSWLNRRFMFFNVDEDSDASNTFDWWTQTYASFLFRPRMNNLTQPADVALEDGVELLIERLAVPNLWLQPTMFPYEYIRDLPTWTYEGAETSESDTEYKSDTEHICSAQWPQSKLPAGLPSAADISKYDADCSCHSDKLLEPTSKDETCLESKTNRSPRRVKESKATSLLQDKENLIPACMIPCSECAICLEVYASGVLVCGLPCGHSFHHVCIMGWLTRDNHCCPVCRWPTYKPKSLHLHRE